MGTIIITIISLITLIAILIDLPIVYIPLWVLVASLTYWGNSKKTNKI